MQKQLSFLLVVLALLGATLLADANTAEAAPKTITSATLERTVLTANPEMMPNGEELHRLEALTGQLQRQIRNQAAAAGFDTTTIPERWSSLDYRNPKHRFGYFRTVADWRAHVVNVKASAGVLAQAAQLPPEAGATIAIELHRAGDDALRVGRAHDQWKLFRKRIEANSRFRNLIHFSVGYVEFGKDPTDPEPAKTATVTGSPTVSTAAPQTTATPSVSTQTVTAELAPQPTVDRQPTVAATPEPVPVAQPSAPKDWNSVPTVLMARDQKEVSYSGNIPTVLMADSHRS